MINKFLGNKKKWGLFLFLIFFWSGLSYWRCMNGLGNTHSSFAATGGDGAGTIVNAYLVHEEIKNKGLGLLLGDTFKSSLIAAGLQRSEPFSMFWKLNNWLLLYFFTPDNAYDFNVFLGMVLIGAGAFFLATELGLPFLLSIMLGLFFTYLDNFYSRATGHLTLATYFGPVFLLWGVSKLISNIEQLKYWLLYAFLLTFNFLVNEYWGYFGGIFSLVLLVGSLAIKLVKRSFAFKQMLRNGIISGLFFLGLMSLSYPNLILPKIFRTKNAAVSLQDLSRPTSDFYYYSLRKEGVGVVFTPSIQSLKQIVPSFIANSVNGPEMTFRIGFAVPALILIFLLLTLVLSKILRLNQFVVPWQNILLWCLASGVLFLFALTPESKWSLGKISMKFAPMLRCGARGLLLFDIGLVTVFLLLLNVYWQWFNVRLKSTQNFFSKIVMALGKGAVLGVALFAWADTKSDGSLELSKLTAYSLPNADLYQPLVGLPNGHLLELPFYHRAVGDVADFEYLTVYFSSVHKKPIVNFIWNYKNQAVVDRFGSRVNYPNAKLVLLLKRLGIRYIVARFNSRYNFEYFNQDPNLERIGGNAEGIIFKIKGTESFDSKIFEDVALRDWTVSPQDIRFEPATPHLNEPTRLFIATDEDNLISPIFDAIDRNGKYVAMTPTYEYSQEHKSWVVSVTIPESMNAETWNFKDNGQIIMPVTFKPQNEFQAILISPEKLKFDKPINFNLLFSKNMGSDPKKWPVVILDAINSEGKYVALTLNVRSTGGGQKLAGMLAIPKNTKARVWNIKINNNIVRSIEVVI